MARDRNGTEKPNRIRTSPAAQECPKSVRGVLAQSGCDKRKNLLRVTELEQTGRESLQDDQIFVEDKTRLREILLPTQLAKKKVRLFQKTKTPKACLTTFARRRFGK